MKIILGLFLTLVGALVGFGELTYSQYFAGEKVKEVVLLDNGIPVSNQIEVTQDDLPVRLNLEIFCSRKRTSMARNSQIPSYYTATITTGGDAAGDNLSFQGSLTSKHDRSNLTLSSGNVSVGSNSVPALVRSTQLLTIATPGIWDLGISVSNEKRCTVNTINADVIFGSQAVRWNIAGPGLAALFVGFILLMVGLRAKSPHLAT